MRGSGGVVVVRDWVRSALWPLPVMGVVVALLLGILLPLVDGRLDDTLPAGLQDLLFGGGAGAATTVLDSIASSTITVTSLTFSLTVVTLQLASSQFSPRLLRTFTSDIFVQVTLALFLATFTYSLTVLRSVRSEDSSQAEVVPQLSVTVAFGLVVASVIGLVLFLGHLAQVIRVETMLLTVGTGAGQTIRRVLELREDSPTPPPAPEPPAHPLVLLAPRSGFIVQVDREKLVEVAVRTDAVLLLDRPAGSSIVDRTPVGAAWSRTSALDQEQKDALQDGVAAAVTTGKERTSTEDIGYGLRQLTDVAVKALSPGINDPTTAVHALGHSASLLCELTRRRLGAEVLTDDDGVVRVVLGRPELGDLLELAVAQPRRYGAADPDVLARIATLLVELAWVVELPAHREAVTAQTARLRHTVGEADFDDTERRMLEEFMVAVDRGLQRTWAPASGTP